mgnify:CR=1 FL=1
MHGVSQCPVCLPCAVAVVSIGLIDCLSLSDKTIASGRKACFAGAGYLELPRNLLPSSSPRMKVQLTLRTSSSNGVIYWQGQPSILNGAGRDFFGIGLEDGFVKFRLEAKRYFNQ